MDSGFLEMLLADGVVRRPDAQIEALTGGISSEIYKVRDGSETFVVKRALARLKVADEWLADVSRNAYEVAYLRLVGGLVPGAVPAIRTVSEAHGYFAMEFLGERFENWKTLLLRGEIVAAHAVEAGRVLGAIHRATWDDDATRRRFDTTASFRQLRTDPYLLTTGRRHPALETWFVEETARIESTRRCLVHGDYSPKNLLIAGWRLVVLDCEVAWFGDPAFDVAFLMNHFFIKALHLPAHREKLLAMARAAWASYRRELGEGRADEVERTLPRLLLMLMLARVDGKSPMDYLRDNETGKTTIRQFTARQIPAPPGTLADLINAWNARLA